MSAGLANSFSNEVYDYSEIDLLLRRFVEKAGEDQIWVSKSVKDLYDPTKGNQLCKILEMALEIARKNCIASNLPRERTIQIHSRNIQHRIFVKIQYSCHDHFLEDMDPKIARLQKLVESAEGYFNMQLENDNVDIKIAFPTNYIFPLKK